MDYYKLEHYDINSNNKKELIDGRYFFHKLKNSKGEEVLIKPVAEIKEIISEVFHSALGNELGLPVAQNAPVVINEESEIPWWGISSKNFLKPGEELVSMHDSVKDWCNVRYCGDNENIYAAYKEFGISNEDFTKYLLETVRSHNGSGRPFQAVDLEDLFKRLKNCTPELERSIVKNYLMAHISDNLQNGELINLGIIQPSNIAAPYFDMGKSANFVGKRLVECSIDPCVAKFLKTNHSSVVKEFSERAIDLSQSPKLKKISNFLELAELAKFAKVMEDTRNNGSAVIKKTEQTKRHLADLLQLQKHIYPTYQTKLQDTVRDLNR